MTCCSGWSTTLATMMTTMMITTMAEPQIDNHHHLLRPVLQAAVPVVPAVKLLEQLLQLHHSQGLATTRVT